MSDTHENDQCSESELCSADELIRRAHALEEWAYAEGLQNPALVEVALATRKMLKFLMQARFVWAAMNESPRRAIDGKNGAIENLGGNIPRSTIYKFVNEDLGLETDKFRGCRSMEEIIEASASLKELALNVSSLYEEHQKNIESFGIGL